MTLANSLDYYQSSSDPKPNCPHCYSNDCMELVDMTITPLGDSSEFIPVWFCRRCRRLSYGRDDIVAGFITYTCTSKSDVESKLTYIEARICNLEDKVSRQHDDILQAIENRVNNFTLQ